jgi:hypothetical protein
VRNCNPPHGLQPPHGAAGQGAATRMPSGTKAEKAAKRRAVAKGIVAGKSTKRIAKEAQCTERHVQRLAAEKPTQFLIAEMLRPHRAKLEKLAGACITAIEKAMGAKVGDTADHKARLWGVDRYRNMLELAQGGRPQEKPPDGAQQVTWEEFVVMYRSRKVTDESVESGTDRSQG